MRTIVGFGSALLLTFALSAPARVATAGEGQSAVEEANAALAAQPPQRDAARSALDRAAAVADDPKVVSEAYFRLGMLDEEEEAFAQAMAHYRACLAAKAGSSGSRWARNASKRMQWLTARSEGDFAPLARLYRFKRDPAGATDPEAVAAFAGDVETFPPGSVRAESRMLVAFAWLGPLHRAHDAIPLFRQVATDPTADAPTLRFGERGLVDALLADGQLDEAAKEAKAHTLQLEPEVVTRLQKLLRRRTLLRGSRIVLAALIVLSAVALAYARWKHGSLRKALRATRTPARVAAALSCAVAVVAASIVLLGAFAPTYLERIGF